METENKYRIDTRTADEIRAEIAETAHSYTPEWKFNVRNPDAGSLIGIIFAGQMADTIQRINLLPEKYQVEFVNLFGVTLQPAKPARAIVVIEAGGYGRSAIEIPCRTQLLGESAQGDDVIFETEYDICVTGSKLIYILGISGEYCKIIPYQGEDMCPAYPVPMFCYDGQGLEQEALLLYHSYLYDSETKEIRIRFRGNKQAQELAKLFTSPEQFQFTYHSASGMTVIEDAGIQGDTVVLHLKQEMAAVSEQGQEQYLIRLNMLRQVEETIELSAIELLPAEGRTAVHYISNGIKQMDARNFQPFGEQLAVYSECYIGQELVFSKQGAEVTLCFDLEFTANNLAVQSEDKTESLPIVKRKPRQLYQGTGAVCYAQEISLEYYNGIGWKQLPCLQNVEQLFAKTANSGAQVIRFIIPEHWQSIQVGGYEEKCLRIMLTKADNCYIRPGTHYYPVMKNLSITYRYLEQFLQPGCLKRIVGSKETDITQFLMEKRPFIGFSIFPYSGNYMYFGFDKKFEGGPVSLFFKVREDRDRVGMAFTYEYASPAGFKNLQVIDHTRQLRGSGTVLFQPPGDMVRTMVEGRSGYFIRIVQNGAGDGCQFCYPVLEQLRMNAVNVRNIEQQDIQEYTIDVIGPNMSFPLYATDILDADVWVNEKDQTSAKQMKLMIKEKTEQVEAVYNVLGEIEEFYVKWTEAENFDMSSWADRHYLIDRLHNTIQFGDGISVRIPRNIQGIAFKTSVRCCSGEAGNLEAGQINDFRSNIFPVDSVENIMPAYGGSQPEDMEHSLQRGSNLLSAGKRLVSESDYLREIKAFSDHIDKAACICGQKTSDGAEDRSIYIVLLMKEYRQGSYSFQTVKDSLRQHLLTQCEMTCIDEIVIVEPIFIRITVEVWLLVQDITDAFTIRQMWQEQIEDYLEPVTHGKWAGWEIGSIPKEAQIHMMLRGLEQRTYAEHHSFAGAVASMERYSVRASYHDATGIHHMALEEVFKSPFVIGSNGEHHIHMRMKGG